MMDMYGDYCPELLAKPVEERALAWIIKGEAGISSKTIWAVCVNVDTKNPLFNQLRKSFWDDVPHDPADFRRCYLLLRLIPEWRGRLPEVAAKFPKWRPFVKNWDELTTLYEEERGNPDGMAPKLYARMKELRNQSGDASE